MAESNIVDRHIRSLRIKLQNDYRHPRFIATVPGRGYRFIPTFSNTGWDGEAGPGPAAAQLSEPGRARHEGLAAATPQQERDRPGEMTDRHDAAGSQQDTDLR